MSCINRATLNRIAYHTRLMALIDHCRDELQNRHWNFAANFPTAYKRTLDFLAN